MDRNLDQRLNAYRDDLADIRLEGRVYAARFVEGHKRQIITPLANLHKTPDIESGIDTQAQFGEIVQVFEEGKRFSWCRCESDGYVGYVPNDAIGPALKAPSHGLNVPRSFIYCEANLKSRAFACIGMGAQFSVLAQCEFRGTSYSQIGKDQWVISRHVTSLEDNCTDFVSVAQSLLHTPYLWGGNSAFGIDCSALVQLSLRRAGVSVLRDSDMQMATIGTAIKRDELQRGDLVFWKGHVAIMLDEHNLIHANGHSMSVAIEPIHEAIARIGYLYGDPISFQRP